MMQYVSYTTIMVIEYAINNGIMKTVKEFSGCKVNRVSFKNGLRGYWSHGIYKRGRTKLPVVHSDYIQTSIKSISDLLEVCRLEKINARKVCPCNSCYTLGENPNNIVTSGSYDRLRYPIEFIDGHKMPTQFKILECSHHTSATFQASKDPSMFGKTSPVLTESQAILHGVGGETDRDYIVEFPSIWAKQVYMLNRY